MTGAEDNEPSLAPSQRRLQRPPDFTGSQLTTFRDVFIRHGLPGACLGALCLVHPQMRELLIAGLAKAQTMPLTYLTGALLVLLGLSLYAWYLDGRLSLMKLGWVVYLGALSTWEEWVFRLAIPYYVESQGGALLPAVIGSNILFGLAHYFTLRWKWQWCLFAFLGGLAFSRQMAEHSDLLLVIGIHWVATFLNTPRLPGQTRKPR